MPLALSEPTLLRSGFYVDGAWIDVPTSPVSNPANGTTIGINAAILGKEVAPFGGVKESGFGREGGCHGIEECAEMKYLLVGGPG